MNDYRSANTPALSRGTRYHYQHDRKIYFSRLTRVAAYLLFVIALGILFLYFI